MNLSIDQTNLWAGGPSMIILIQRICIAFNGLGKWKTVESVIRLRAAILLQKNKIKHQRIQFYKSILTCSIEIEQNFVYYERLLCLLQLLP